MIFREKTMFIARGLPGSGKSFGMKKIERYILDYLYSKLFIFSTDQYWINESGDYDFDATNLYVAHMWNQRRVLKAVDLGCKYIGVDNTNVTLRDMKPYIDMAVDNGYSTAMIYPSTNWAFDVDECYRRNEHDVPHGTIERMKNKFAAHSLVELNYGRDFSRIMI